MQLLRAQASLEPQLLVGRVFCFVLNNSLPYKADNRRYFNVSKLKNAVLTFDKTFVVFDGGKGAKPKDSEDASWANKKHATTPIDH